MSSSTARPRKNTAFKPPRPSNSTAATRTPRRSSPTFSSSPPQQAAEEPQTQPESGPLDDDDDTPPLIPQKLLTRLLQHHFEDAGTRLGKDANELLGQYMEIFLKEALARAVHEKNKARQSGEGIGGDFLEVEDLEKMAPQLVLDF